MTRIAVIAAAAIGALVSVPLLAAAGAAGGAVPTSEALGDIPPAYLALYQTAIRDRCPTLPWSVLAAIGKIESDHGRTGGAHLGPDGRVEPRIIGVALDGSPGTRQVRDTDDGLYDGDGIFDRAVGPMQFIPSTWASTGLDASGDGLADAHNAIDAVHAAASYLCSVGADDPSRIRGWRARPAEPGPPSTALIAPDAGSPTDPRRMAGRPANVDPADRSRIPMAGALTVRGLLRRSRSCWSHPPRAGAVKTLLAGPKRQPWLWIYDRWL